MIVDCHTHIWNDVRQLGQGAEAVVRRQSGQFLPDADGDAHAKASHRIDKTLVLGYRSRHLGANVPNELIAEYVAGSDGKTIGIAAVDPTDPADIEQAENLLARREFRGLTISPAAQNYHPADTRAMKLYELACRLNVPVFFQQGTHFPTRGSMEHARPLLLDEIAQEFSDLTLVVSSLGHPWVEECIALLGKHPRVFSDISGLVRRPWQAYNALVLTHQFHVMDKILFGSDFPFFTAPAAIEALYRLHEVTQGTNLPTVPREILRSVVERDALGLLGIARPGEQPAPPHEKEVKI